jgi:hypothetical protein
MIAVRNGIPESVQTGSPESTEPVKRPSTIKVAPDIIGGPVSPAEKKL